MKYNKNICLKSIIIFLFILTICSTCFATDTDENIVTEDLEVMSSLLSNNEGKGIYEVYIGEERVSIVAEEYNLPSNLYKYNEDIRLRVTYSKDTKKIRDCKVINYRTGEIIDNLSEENLDNLFNIEKGKTVIAKEWVNTIKLSELTENEIYKYTYTNESDTSFPTIENDIGKNCIIYLKEKDKNQYEQEINMSKEISGKKLTVHVYSSGESFCIMYREIKNDELLKRVGKDKTIYLSKYNDGDKLEYKFEEYIYNDTDKKITINTEDEFFGQKETKIFEIEPGEIYGFDWMIKSATISYSKDTSDKKDDSNKVPNEQKEEKKEEQKNNLEQEKKDNTILSTKLPQTGVSDSIFIMILIFVITMIIIKIKSNKYKDVE